MKLLSYWFRLVETTLRWPGMLRALCCLTMHVAAQVQVASSAVELRHIETSGIKLHIAEIGSGPLVLLVHGWPESWYSWRHQLPVLAAAGYRAVAPRFVGKCRVFHSPLRPEMAYIEAG